MIRNVKPTDAAAFESAIRKLWKEGETRGAASIDVVSGDLHRKLGGYPGLSHRMPDCCQVMRRLMKASDEVVAEPPKGEGATLVIRYALPR